MNDRNFFEVMSYDKFNKCIAVFVGEFYSHFWWITSIASAESTWLQNLKKDWNRW